MEAGEGPESRVCRKQSPPTSHPVHGPTGGVSWPGAPSPGPVGPVSEGQILISKPGGARPSLEAADLGGGALWSAAKPGLGGTCLWPARFFLCDVWAATCLVGLRFCGADRHPQAATLGPLWIGRVGLAPE